MAFLLRINQVKRFGIMLYASPTFDKLCMTQHMYGSIDRASRNMETPKKLYLTTLWCRCFSRLIRLVFYERISRTPTKEVSFWLSRYPLSVYARFPTNYIDTQWPHLSQSHKSKNKHKQTCFLYIFICFVVYHSKRLN